VLVGPAPEQPADPAQDAKAGPDDDELMQFDLTADGRWNAGCDFALGQLCKALGVDPSDVLWDAATETVEGDVSAVIGNIFSAKFGEDWTPSAARSPAAIEAVRAAYTKEAAERDVEIAQLRGTVDLLERNAGIQARLLAATARERDLAVSQVEKLTNTIKRIDAINDNPARFNVEIDEVCRPFTSTDRKSAAP
jgi:phosphoglycolate phosphatase-like HAD superfamily hydrolase